ncbi:adenosylcobinamide-GDP ribazoletransferase [Dasania marina]|uniref:adenosylcobinamide-GDP ribazoletransferase n=1 Tax=Dasania marina TaxID=471499 RepID=UPI0004AEDD54|nr:adenosylcobinamide-GDP ribazoletransferase [Dasania marina]
MPKFSLRPIITAFMFLTRIPMPELKDFQPQDSGRALAYFPVVGLVIGLLMLLIAQLIAMSPLVLAALLLTFWVFITGGLHIDGLADSADGWLGGTRDKERSLEIMKDPVCGSAAVMAVGCLLIIKFAALTSLLEQAQLSALLLAPIIGRCVPLILFLSTPYVRKDGLAQHFISYSSKPAIYAVLLTVLLLCFVILSLPTALIVLSSCALILLGLRYLMMDRLQGNTGDTTGAAVEIIEATVLIALCIS